jgi:hypothetical protein
VCSVASGDQQPFSGQIRQHEPEPVHHRYHAELPPCASRSAPLVNRKQFVESRQEATEVFTYLLAGIAGVSLVVGGIGIMNIMLVVVRQSNSI